MPPSVRQASLLSLRKDQWQFEPLEFLVFNFLVEEILLWDCVTLSQRPARACQTQSTGCQGKPGNEKRKNLQQNMKSNNSWD